MWRRVLTPGLRGMRPLTILRNYSISPFSTSGTDSSEVMEVMELLRNSSSLGALEGLGGHVDGLGRALRLLKAKPECRGLLSAPEVIRDICAMPPSAASEAELLPRLGTRLGVALLRRLELSVASPPAVEFLRQLLLSVPKSSTAKDVLLGDALAALRFLCRDPSNRRALLFGHDEGLDGDGCAAETV
eukprot:RCo015069